MEPILATWAMKNRYVAIHGKADHVSKEQVRAFVLSSLIVLGYHNLIPTLPLKITFVRSLGKNIAGDCLDNNIRLRRSLDVEEMFTTILHEVIHSCRDFPEETKEKCTSTLNSKLKPDVAAIAKILLDGTYKRAAYLAHTKITYKTADKDFYDPGEDTPLGIQPKYKRVV
jgi:hypothetical protein